MRWTGGKVLLLFVAVAGCAGADVYLDKELEHKTGLPFYMAKPYLLVTRTGISGSVNVDVVYLPDLEHPLYAAQRVGIGKAKLTVKMTDGKLTEFVADADSKAAELTGALTAGLKSIAEALKIQREAELLRARAAAAREREALAARLEGMADELSEAAARLTGREKADAERMGDTLRREAAKLRTTTADEGSVADALEAQLQEAERVLAPEAKREWRRIIARLRAMARVGAADATFELYEFRMEDGRTTLVPVALPQATGAAPAPTSAG
jgi:hypothetical protein